MPALLSLTESVCGRYAPDRDTAADASLTPLIHLIYINRQEERIA